MQYYLNLHHVLDKRRFEAKESGQQGPRVIIVPKLPFKSFKTFQVGGTDSGKTTVSRILINYAVRMGWAPVYVDLDPGQGNISPPGTIAATPVQLPVTVEDGYPLEVPLVYFHGHSSPGTNPEHFKLLVENMSAVLEKRAVMNPTASHSGTVINTMGWTEGVGYELLIHSLLTLKVMRSLLSSKSVSGRLYFGFRQ